VVCPATPDLVRPCIAAKPRRSSQPLCSPYVWSGFCQTWDLLSFSRVGDKDNYYCNIPDREFITTNPPPCPSRIGPFSAQPDLSVVFLSKHCLLTPILMQILHLIPSMSLRILNSRLKTITSSFTVSYSFCFLPNAASILSQISTSYCVTRLIACPDFPARAVLPTR